MQSIKEKEGLDFFEIYEEKFKKIWSAYSRKQPSQVTDTLIVTLAEGCPLIRGVELELPPVAPAIVPTAKEPNGEVKAKPESKTVALMTIKDVSTQEASAWKLEWLVLYVNRALAKLGVDQKINPSQIYGVWLRFLCGEEVTKIPLGGIASLLSSSEEGEEVTKPKPYSIVANKSKREVSLVIRDWAETSNLITIPRLVEAVRMATVKVSQQLGGRFNLLRKELYLTLQSYKSGPESIGIDLPIVLLGAFEMKDSVGKGVSVFNSYAHSSLNPNFRISIADDGLTATIDRFESKAYKDPSLFLSDEWLRKEAKRAGLSDEACLPFIPELQKEVSSGISIEGKVIAKGFPGTPGSGATLVECYKDRPRETEDAETVVDLRSMQQPAYVSAGKIIAEIRYEKNATYGRDVFGLEKEPPPSEVFEVKLKEGIIEKVKGKFFAEYSGIPVIENNSIFISKVLIHKGDVNLRTGNIFFDGPVEIQGSIDSGAVVEVKGDLTVRGSIRAGHVRCFGNVEVSLGIVTGSNGIVWAKKNLKADFIENSRIQCGGSVTVRKAIINTDLISGGMIQVTNQQDGVIAGGNLSCREYMKTGNLGFRNGSVTKLNIGVDWKIEKAVRIRTSRLEKLVEVQEADRQALREVLARGKNQMTDKHEKRKRHYQDRLIQERSLIDKAQIHLDKAKNLLKYNPDSKVLVYNRIFENVEMRIGGGVVPIKTEMIGVAVLAKKRNGSKIISVEAGERMQDQEKSDENEDKKD